jgi:transposase
VDGYGRELKRGVSEGNLQGGWYVLFSRTRDRVRIFYWDRDGYAMCTKRVEAGSYKVEKRDGYEELTAIDLTAIIERLQK